MLPMLSGTAFEFRNRVPTDETPAEVLDLPVPKMELARLLLVFPDAVDELDVEGEKEGSGDRDRDARETSEP